MRHCVSRTIWLGIVVAKRLRPQDASACVVSSDNETVCYDASHALLARPGPSIANAGPGTELAKLLKRFGINPTPTCQCRAKAREMDAWGPDECEKPERIEQVLGVMREEAKARGLPFVDAAGRMLIRRAIRNARRAAS